VTKIVRKTGRLNYLRIKPLELRCVRLDSETILSQPAPNLCNFVGVLLARVKNVELASSHDLRNTG